MVKTVLKQNAENETALPSGRRFGIPADQLRELPSADTENHVTRLDFKRKLKSLYVPSRNKNAEVVVPLLN